jgi:putative phosphoesterase
MIYVISDTHIPERASRLPRKFVEKIKKDDTILHAGDFTEIKAYRNLGSLATLHAVCGNMDHPEIRKLLPPKRLLELFGFRIGLIHGSGPPFGLVERVYREFDDNLDVIVFGHSHFPYNLIQGNTLLFNPGSLSGNFPSWKKSYGILQIDEKKIRGEVVYIA